jgi:hypothetical protein
VVIDNDGDGVGDDECHTLACLDDPRRLAVGVFGYPLDAVAGPSVSRVGPWHVGGELGGWFGSPLAPGRRAIATLTLNIADVPGKYPIVLLSGMHLGPDGRPQEIPPGAPFTVTVAP